MDKKTFRLISKRVSSRFNVNLNDDVNCRRDKIDSRFVRGYSSKDPYHRFSHLALRFVYRRPVPVGTRAYIPDA